MAAQSELDVVIQGQDNLTPSLSQIESRLIRFVGAVSSALATIQFVAFPVAAVRDFEREMANVQKTTNFTDTQIKYLSQDIAQLSTTIDVSATDLAKIAAAAGQQGLGREGTAGILQFTQSVARMSSVLDITVEDAATAIGKLTSIFKLPISSIENIASAFNQVSNNSTAAGDQLIDVVKRVGDAAGALNIQQALGIGATLVDFGASAEVAGTSLTKIFADMQSKAEKFSKLLNATIGDGFKISADGWIKEVQGNGIDALKLYLTALRKLDGESRQAAIRDLSGTGRIGAALNKLVGDTLNTVLDRNLDNANKGLESGTSAIKEQQTVLKTLDAQIKIATNSFKLLGITAGEQFAGPLAGYLAQISKELQSPAVISFAESLGKAFLDLFKTVASGVQFLAGLNINWENFITVGTLLVKLKLGEYIAKLIIGFTGLGSILKSVAIAGTEASVAVSKVGVGTGDNSSLVGAVTNLKQMIAARKEYQAAVTAQQEAEARMSADQIALNAALEKQDKERTALAYAQSTGVGPARNTAGAAQALQAAQASTAVQAVQDQLNTRLEAAETAHNARMLAIQETQLAERQAIYATGSRTGLAELQRTQTAQIAAEEASYAKSIAGIQGYYNRRLAIVEQEVAAEVALRQQALVAAQAAEVSTAAAAGTAAAAANVATAEAGVARLTTRLAESSAAAGAAAVTTNTLSLAVTGLGASFRLLGTIVSVALRVLGTVAFWGTIAFTILDLVGGVDALRKVFGGLTDAIGLTSEAQRKKAQADKDENDALIRKNALLDDTIKKYTDLQDASGKLDPTQVAALPTLIAGDSTVASDKALNQVTTLIDGAKALIAKNQDQLQLLPDQRAAKAAELADRRRWRYVATGLCRRWSRARRYYDDSQRAGVKPGDLKPFRWNGFARTAVASFHALEVDSITRPTYRIIGERLWAAYSSARRSVGLSPVDSIALVAMIDSVADGVCIEMADIHDLLLKIQERAVLADCVHFASGRALDKMFIQLKSSFPDRFAAIADQLEVGEVNG